MEGWTVLGEANGAAVLEGPDGFWRVKRGDTVPELEESKLLFVGATDG